jgi:hypothetical protein
VMTVARMRTMPTRRTTTGRHGNDGSSSRIGAKRRRRACRRPKRLRSGFVSGRGIRRRSVERATCAVCSDETVLGRTARLAAASEFVEFFRSEERLHLRDEEEELFPLLLRHVQSQPAPLREARIQHVQLQGFARKLGIAVAAGLVDRKTLDAAGELLEAHIRLEERQLFPLIEELVPDHELRRLRLADRDATCIVRRPPLMS